MIQSPNKSLPTINIDGPDGNAFAVMGFTSNILKQLKTPSNQINDILQEMQSSDYLNLISVAYSYVGAYTIWETENSEYLKVLNRTQIMY